MYIQLYIVSTSETAQCSATGDPHYLTFDGRRYDFMGVCEYVLSKDLSNNFLILTKNERCNGPHFSCVFSVTVTIKGLKIKIARGGLFTVFGVRKNAPYSNQGKKSVLHSRELHCEHTCRNE